MIENGLDFAYAPFVHGSTFGDRDHPPKSTSFDVAGDLRSGHAQMIRRRPKSSELSQGGPLA
ncbi:hypothetical protein [Pseudomonas sp. NPDC087336]|uniref:hypothetical protein n=1 Tax=Pseudomonas sp. NPDC087336 TaxID=3364436 RepID=UPI00382A4CA0